MAACACQQSRCLLCEATLSRNGLSLQQACEVRGLVARRVFRPRETLFQQGMPVNELHMVRYGYVKLTTSLPDGRAQGLQLSSLFGLVGIEALDSDTYPCTAEAVTDVQVCTVRRDDLLELIQEDPVIARRLLGMLNRELGRSMALIRNLGVMDATERVAAFLHSIAPETALDDEVPLPMSRGDIGQILGLTVETVSRSLSRLKKAGVIDLPPLGRHFRVLDWERLATLGARESVAARDCA